MKTKLILLTVVMAFLPLAATADTLTFVPSFQQVPLGGVAMVDVVYSGESLVGDYGFFVLFDPGIVTLEGAAVGSGLGYYDAWSDIATCYVPGGGTVELCEVSFLADFTGYQTGGDLVLATLTFRGIGVGLTELEFGEAIWMGDEFGEPIELEAGEGAIEVLYVPGAEVPEPATMLLVGSGALALLRLRRK